MKAIKLLSILSLIVLIIGCGSGNKVTITKFDPQGKVQNLTTFKIEFSENLAPADVQDKWLTDQFVIFEPKIEGKFKWISGNTLIFSPDYPLQAIQDYKAKVTDKVLFNTKYASDFDTYEFHTPDFDANKVEFFWTRIPNQDYKLSVQANLYFNYAVSPEQLKNNLEITRGGEEVKDFQVVSDKPSEVMAINLGEVKQTDRKQKLEIKIKKGLMSVIGKKPLQDEREFSQNLPPITKLAITSVSSGFDGTTGWIVVSTTQTVDDKQVGDYVKITPEKKLTFTVNENQFRIEGDFSDVQTAHLKISKGLPGLYGGQLEFDYEQDVVLVNINPSINFTDKAGIYMMLSGQKNLEVNAVNETGAEVEVLQVFKNNLLYFLNSNSYRFRRYNYDDEDYYYDDYYNSNGEFYVSDYGKEIYSEKINLSNKKNWLQKFTINLSKALNQQRKGVFVVNVHATNDRWERDSKMVAISDLGIICKKSRR